MTRRTVHKSGDEVRIADEKFDPALIVRVPADSARNTPESSTVDTQVATATLPELGTLAMRLPLASIDSSPLNPRKHFDDEDLQQLADSLAADGLLQPIVIAPAGDRYVIVAGERRWRAAQRLGWIEIAAVIRSDLDEAGRIRLALLENLARTDLDPLEEAVGYRQLQELGMTQTAIAAAVHRSQPAIANAIRLLRLPQKVLEWIQAGQLSPSHGVALLRYETVPQI